MDAPAPLDQAKTALTLVAIDPKGLGGMVIKGRASPARDALVADLERGLPQPVARIAPTVPDAQLDGGLDVAQTLATRQIVVSKGMVHLAKTLLLPMAERLTSERAARFAHAIDEGRAAIALDEGIDDETIAYALQDRMAFRVSTDMISAHQSSGISLNETTISSAQKRLTKLPTKAADIETLATLAATLGIQSLRALHLAYRCARAHAALMAHETVDETDILVAATLVLAHRATQKPNAEDQPQDQPLDRPDETESKPQSPTLDDDILLEAVKAALPPDLLDRLNSGRSRRASGSGSGAKKRGNRRGRPLPARHGKLDGRGRLDVVATLRAAAPWQTIRARASGRDGLHIHPTDFHIKRFEETSDRLLVFAVDASGSAAFARLAEAKGAVELLLAEAYARRDHVALVAFRGDAAEVLLPPTRSLVQTKRRLAALPGGGGTPLAAGLQAALDVARTAGRKGLTPTIAVLTDGRANIALDGQPNRPEAREDANKMARIIAAEGVETLVIDTGNRPEPDLKTLSHTAMGHYIPLPRADAKRLATAVSDALA